MHFLLMDVLGLRVPFPTGGPPRHAPNLEHPQGVENFGALAAKETSWAQTYTLKALPLQHPALPRGSGVLLPHQHHRSSVQKRAALTQATGKPTAAAQWEKLRMWPLSQAEMALLPKQGLESCRTGSAGQSHASLLSDAGRWCWPRPSPHTRANTATARVPRDATALQTRMALVMYYGPSAPGSPPLTRGAKSHFL